MLKHDFLLWGLRAFPREMVHNFHWIFKRIGVPFEKEKSHCFKVIYTDIHILDFQ